MMIEMIEIYDDINYDRDDDNCDWDDRYDGDDDDDDNDDDNFDLLFMIRNDFVTCYIDDNLRNFDQDR